MKALILTGKHEVHVGSFPEPPMDENSVKVAVAYCGLCGTDLHKFEGQSGSRPLKLPVPLGHEVSGIVEAVGANVRGFRPGDRVTVVHSVMQALAAAKAGADYVAPYVNKIDDLGADGIGCVAQMVTAFRNGGYPCKVLGASFRNVDQIQRLAAVGCHAVTIKAEFFAMLIAHPATDAAMAGFRQVWKDTYGDRQVSDLLPE